jgi:predicted NACHT family NTPase
MTLLASILSEFISTFLPRAAGAVSAKLAADKLFSLKFSMKLARMLASIDEDLLLFAESEGMEYGQLSAITDLLRIRLPLALSVIEAADWSRGSVNTALHGESKFIDTDSLLDERSKYIYTQIFEQSVTSVYILASRAKNVGNEDIRVILDLLEHVAAKINSIEINTEKIPNKTNDRIAERLRSVLSRRAIFESIDPYGVAPVSGQALDFNKFFIEPYTSSRSISRTAGDFFKNVVMTSNQRILLYGGAGAGKTTLSNWFEKLGNTEIDNNMIVVRVPLRDVKGPEFFSVRNILEYRINRHVLNDIDSYIITRLTDTSSFVFIFDGFDEISLGNRDAYSSALEDFATLVAPSSILVTSRRLSTEHLEKIHATEFEIEPLRPDQISEYITKYASSYPSKSAHRDFAKIDMLVKSNKKINYLASNPLMLATIATVYAIDGALAIDVYDLYKRFIDAMTFHWHSRKGIGEVHA